MTSPSPIRVALIGYGPAGSIFHAPLISAVPDLRLAAIVTSNAERQAAASARYPGTRIVEAFDDVIAHAGDFDLAVIATSNRSHVPLARRALEAGLAVVVDKPLARTAREAVELDALAQSRNLLFSVFQNRRWDGDFLTVQRLIADGDLGHVHRFENRFERWRPEVLNVWRESNDPEDVGGVLYDLGSHVIDQALVLFGPVASVYAEIDVRRAGGRSDDDAFLALTHESGVLSHLWMSKLTASLGPRFRVLGNRAAYVKFGLDPQEDALRAGADPMSAECTEEAPAKWGHVEVAGEQSAARTEPGAYHAYYAQAARALRGDGPAPVELSQVIACLAVLEAAVASAKSRTVETPRAP